VRVADLERGTVTQVVEGVLADWTPAGEVTYTDGEESDYGLYKVPWDRARPAERVAEFWRYAEQVTWLPDSRGFVFAIRLEGEPRGPRDLFIGAAGGDSEPWLTTERNEESPQLSPDGNWIAYAAAEAGSSDYHVFIQPFPGPGGQLQVSVEAGRAPRWAGDGRRIFFWSEDGAYEVAVELGDVPAIGTPVRLFDGPGGADFAPGDFDASSDGERFAITMPIEDLEPNVLHVAYDWLPEIEALFADR
jgi:Tol biopolymer transport system component